MIREHISTLLPWALLFLLLNAMATPPTSFPAGATNSLSRFATMRAMLELGTFRIDAYEPTQGPIDSTGWTVDWARTPDGHHYSNKAPGPMFLGFPLFAAYEWTRRWVGPERPVPDTTRVPATEQRIISFGTQILPLFALCLVLLHALRDASARARHFAVIAVLFGHTASLYMGCFFGHGMTVIFALATALALWLRWWTVVGLCFGFTLLCDYSGGMLLPGLLIAGFAMNGRDLRWLPRVALGGLLPGALWCWYHTACFGSPLAIANHYQNPLFLDTAQADGNLWGIFDLSLRGDVFLALLFGDSRGLLVTQPWLLFGLAVAVASVVRGTTDRRGLAIFALLGFVLLLTMNACFGAWHGGFTPGPRYMSAGFAVFALIVALRYDASPRPLRIALWIALAVSVLFSIQVYATHLLAPPHRNVWAWQWERLLETDYSYRPLIKLGLGLTATMIATWWAVRRNRPVSDPSR